MNGGGVAIRAVGMMSRFEQAQARELLISQQPRCRQISSAQ
jgi:hypothetical protein